MPKPPDTVTFALFFGTRGFFPESLIAGARRELSGRLQALGYGTLAMDAGATPHGAVETPAEGAQYAAWLAEQQGQYQGVILCLPNFGDETGAVAALRDAGVPILIVAYPDEIDRMDTAQRRDAFCGKFSIMDVFTQYGVPFTAWPPHVMHPDGAAFAEQIDRFARCCRVVAGMRRACIGAIGARTTAFKTVRFDELALERYGLTTETFDLSEVIARVRALDRDGEAYRAKAERLAAYTGWKGVPQRASDNLAALGVVLDEMIAAHGLDCLALRCWLELEKELGIAPCVLLSELNDRGIPAACELDVGNAVAMYALHLASGRPATCLDWNNNWGDEADKCILFHCGPVPQSLMTGRGEIVDHPMFAKALGPGCGWGCNTGRIAPTPMSFASCKTEGGRLQVYLGEGRFTEDVVPREFFGCAGVIEVPQLQEKLTRIGLAGYRHHVSVSPGLVEAALREAFTRYLGYEVTEWVRS